jgi:large subunit ribosomal protein L32
VPVPKRRKTRSKVKMSHANKGLKAPNLSTCPHCHSPKLPHRVCPSCGKYKSETVLDIKEE